MVNCVGPHTGELRIGLQSGLECWSTKQKVENVVIIYIPREWCQIFPQAAPAFPRVGLLRLEGEITSESCYSAGPNSPLSTKESDNFIPETSREIANAVWEVWVARGSESFLSQGLEKNNQLNASAAGRFVREPVRGYIVSIPSVFKSR